jgi:hypothetical protein
MFLLLLFTSAISEFSVAGCFLGMSGIFIDLQKSDGRLRIEAFASAAAPGRDRETMREDGVQG